MTDEMRRALGSAPVDVRQWDADVGSSDGIGGEVSGIVRGWADVICAVLPWRLQADMLRVCDQAGVPMLTGRFRASGRGSEPVFGGWRRVLRCEYEVRTWHGC